MRRRDGETKKLRRPPRTSLPRGIEILHHASLNKGTAFTEKEREALGLRGLLPPRVFTQEQQVLRIMENFRAKPTDLEKYVFMIELQDRNETLFFRVVIDQIEEMMPILYTPTVGEACEVYGHIFRRPRGIYVSIKDRGRVVPILRNWPQDEVRVIVVTDGERILGLGDLGANGMGIPVGKLSLYTACAGVHPALTLPVTIDVGTDNDALRGDPLYIGLQEARHRGAAYDQLLDEFMGAVREVFPRALVQFEDFAGANAFRLLEKYGDAARVFNDDIQGTAAVALAGFYSAIRITGGGLGGQKILFLGAGGAAGGIADLIVSGLIDEGLSTGEARRLVWLVDSKGLVVRSRSDLAGHKRPYAHEHEPLPDLLSSIRALKPTAIVGVSGQPKAFTRAVLEAMADLNERPIVFALSNPTSKAECSARDAYRYTGGRAIFAGGSPFKPVEHEGRTFFPGQGNNAYIFPGVGLGVVASGARRITGEMFFAAAKALAGEVSETDLERGSVYPPLCDIRRVSAVIASAIADMAHQSNLAAVPRPDDLRAHVESQMYEPTYTSYV